MEMLVHGFLCTTLQPLFISLEDSHAVNPLGDLDILQSRLLQVEDT